MFENISLALQGIFSHKLRSLLTMLGIIIGIAAIITIVSTIKGTNEQIKQNLIGSGTDAVNIELYQGDGRINFQWNPVPEGVPVISEKDVEEILKFEGVSNAATYTRREYSDNVFYKNKAFSGSLYGIDKNYFEVYNYFVEQGRSFVEDDFTKFRKVAIIDKDTSQTLFQGENPVGKILEIYNEPFTIIGVAEQRIKFKPVINSFQDYMTYSGNSNGQIFVSSAAWPIICMFDEPQNIVVKCTSTDEMTTAGKKTSDYLNTRITATQSEEGMELAYKNDDLLKQAKQIQDLSASTNNQLILIASISLLVGGIGVMNIMLVSVTERTKEIGLKKALGARRKRILLQFLTEASVLTSIGGVLGVLAGIALSQIISKISMTPVAISPLATVIAVVFSTVIGVVFGIIPAMKASKLNPIEALRSE